jgi:pimeloyl-ACP methyl ester carboxylesterase
MGTGQAVVEEGIELDYELRGSGEPVVLIHWGVATAFAEPLLNEPALADSYQLLTYHRAGFGRSSRVEGPLTIADHARHCQLLMRHVGIEQAHVVGHSSSATIALQLALDFPAAAQTVVSMEAARPVPSTELQAQFIRTYIQPAVQRYRGGDTAGAVDTFFRGVFGEGYGPALEQGLPGSFERAVAEADAFFEQELPALQQWSFSEDDARRIIQPVLLVLGENSTPTFPERRDLLLSWLPNAEPVDLPDARHLLHVERPAAVAEALAGFFARHPLAPYA